MLSVFILFLPIILASEFVLEEHKNYKLLPTDTCGESMADRIIGGSKASLGQFPWMARISYEICENTFEYRCGGALINEKVIITAAHCVVDLPPVDCEGTNMTNFRIHDVILGDHDVDTDPDCEKEVCAAPMQKIKISKVISHPKYNNPKLQNDIAIIILEKPAELTEWVTPICLLSGNHDYTNSTGTVAGWGVTDIFTEDVGKVLQYLNVPISDDDACKKYYAKISPIGESQFCAGGIVGKDSCSGDSGGPLMVVAESDSGPKYSLLGAVSFGYKKCGFSPIPAVYTYVPFYHEWILDNI
ncbi:PREDICTED: serine protease easter [Nicrophorus vespilloides]|uniref:Serine protease easter n=1 Tax=Nicrophorus vespilloides TaxID=110193 RepID=A0ABM1MKE9_NICVS|nr:PREDICTED: serine protease easter [Nicrophorus vespilloides]XP_017775049.1 PREDICTED: serine protease easter [Nicrophorus vespilloides]